MARAKRGETSVLNRQKPKKARARIAHALRRQRVVIVLVVLAVAVGVGCFLASRPNAPDDKTAWKVSLKTEGANPLPEKAADTVLSAVRKNLGTGSKADLRRAARAAQQTDSYQTVNVLRVADNEVVVQIRQREAILCVEADRLRYIAVDGAIYGAADSPEACPGPVLRGLFVEGRGRFAMRDDMTLAVDTEEQAIVREAHDLVVLASEQGITVTALEHRKYRGFFLTLDDRELEVAVGRAPFAGKLTKLDGILSNLKDKGQQALRIELDYQGKAFIKLRKM